MHTILARAWQQIILYIYSFDYIKHRNVFNVRRACNSEPKYCKSSFAVENYFNENKLLNTKRLLLQSFFFKLKSAGHVHFMPDHSIIFNENNNDGQLREIEKYYKIRIFVFEWVGKTTVTFLTRDHH